MDNYSEMHLVGQFYLFRDAFNIWIMEEFEGKTRTGAKRKSFRRVTGYFQNAVDLAHDFSEARMRTVEAKDVQELLNKMADIQKETEAVAEGILSALTAKK